MDVTVRKTNGSYEEYDKVKLMNGIREAYKTAGEECPEAVVVSIAENLYIYDKITSREIRRQVEESLMSINKKVAVAYIEKFDAGLDLRKKRDFIRDYIAASNAATGSKFDANANVTRKNIVTLGQELYKENNIKQNRYIMKDKIKALYGRSLAGQYIKDLESHVLYKHDESGTPGYPYCVAITMYPFLVDGLIKLGGVSVAPTDLKSFCGEFINLVYSISSQFMGAVATPEFLMYLDYFIRKDYGDDYLDHLEDVVEMNAKKRTLVKVIDNYFQQVVHSMNMPAGNRGYQTVFWNISYFDESYFRGVFGDFRFPDGSEPKWETLSWLQKHFMNWFNEERNRYILTFPVETMALLTDGKDDFIDKEYADFTAEMWSKGHSFFCYLSDSPDSLASCCRLRNSITELDKIDESHNHTTHQYSMGTASVSTGSKSVMTINLNRLIQLATRRYFLERKGIVVDGSKALTRADYDKNQLYEYIRAAVTEETERVHKYQIAFNEIIKDFLAARMLDVYQAGFIDMKRQYLTIGVNGLTDAAEFLGLTISPNPEYNEFVDVILETINRSNKKDKTPDTMFNTEFVPGENLSGKNYKWDQKDGFYVSPKHNMYSSYFYNPEDDSLSMIDKFKLHGNEYVKHLDGGSALHMNVAEHLTKDQYRQLLKTAAHYGTNYFTFNCRNTVCNDCGYISKDTLEVCPKCGSHNLDYLTRVIGYLKRVSSFSEMRQVEAAHRFYNHDGSKAAAQEEA
ncbi:MAG: anaerobic ribonucleoside-triphosphate reductase [Bacteroidales bacterium]|uniref:anaerobic ribonucleoside-triphosphate reductase n=1 Tax=Candidatus Cryptobacteroides bacterium TaxID=3085639 RepID=UPI000337742F|nr:anaerobic ribonucleoside-triphosphate reductase [Alistipes sp.]MDY5199129.1 anaerobic ribonucleoside-triphosphate reductase [Candidatus Cryptobacteroides sp.]CCX53134.1 anaerobic ribonucleoside-triphosphate reductase [Alistipes sp. CAG:514]